jgi:hypothetical protein
VEYWTRNSIVGSRCGVGEAERSVVLLVCTLTFLLFFVFCFQEDNELFDAELTIWRREHPQELTREEKQKNVEAALADLIVPQGEVCFKFSQFEIRFCLESFSSRLLFPDTRTREKLLLEW